VIQHRLSTSSLQPNVVLHSNINESTTTTTTSPSSPTNRLDVNPDDRNSTRRQTNSLTTVYEHGSNDLLTDDSWNIRSTTSASDVIHNQTTTDDKPTV